MARHTCVEGVWDTFDTPVSVVDKNRRLKFWTAIDIPETDNIPDILMRMTVL